MSHVDTLSTLGNFCLSPQIWDISDLAELCIKIGWSALMANCLPDWTRRPQDTTMQNGFVGLLEPTWLRFFTLRSRHFISTPQDFPSCRICFIFQSCWINCINTIKQAHDGDIQCESLCGPDKVPAWFHLISVAYPRQGSSWLVLLHPFNFMVFIHKAIHNPLIYVMTCSRQSSS